MTAAEAQKKQHDKQVKGRDIKERDWVRWYRGRTRTGHSTKLNCPWTGPWKVVAQVGKVNYKLSNLEGKMERGLAHEQDLVKVDEELAEAGLCRRGGSCILRGEVCEGLQVKSAILKKERKERKNY